MDYFSMRWRLCACRVNAGYTQKEAAKLVGVSEKTIVDWEAGHTAPNMEKGQRLSEIYGIPLAYMDFTKEGNAIPLREKMEAEVITQF